MECLPCGLPASIRCGCGWSSAYPGQPALVGATTVATAGRGMAQHVGEHSLEGAARDFLHAWGYGMGLVAEDDVTLSEVLTTAAAAYIEVDLGLARSLP